MLEYNTWTIEQHEWNPQQENSIQRQLSFSNDYLCQTAHFEELFVGEQHSETYIKDVAEELPNLSSISIRLHDERLDLNKWEVNTFRRCLHKNQPLLERDFTATSPRGNQLQVQSIRRLRIDKRETLDIEYAVKSINYTGPISILPIIGGENKQNWYPLQNKVNADACWMWIQLGPEDLQICLAMSYSIYKNGTLITQRPIKIEKHHVIGYSHTLPICPGETYTIFKHVVVVDSRNYPKNELIQSALACLTNW